MTSTAEPPITPTDVHWSIKVLCVVLGITNIAFGLLLLLFMLLASLNLNPGSLTHLAIIVTGWPTIPVCLFCGFKMMIRPSRRSLRIGLWAVVMIVLTFLSLWVDGGKGLMH
jgi:hypothetical protein